MSTEFFGQGDGADEVPPCIPMAAFTTMVWVREPLAAPDLPMHRVVADAFAAMRPGSELWQAFDREISRLREEDDISADLALHLRVDFESEQALMDRTFGDENEYVEGTAKQVAERAMDDERFVSERRRARVERAARMYGRRAARALFAVVIPLLCVGAIFGTLGVFANLPSPVPGYLQWPATVLFALVTIISVFDGVSFRRRVQIVASMFERTAVRAARSVVGSA